MSEVSFEDLSIARRGERSDAPPVKGDARRHVSFESWGRTQAPGGMGIDPAALDMGRLPAGGMLPFGNGRSYGDTCLTSTGRHADARSLSRIISFDPTTGVLMAEAGTMLHEITRVAAPWGWFLPVTPGTQFVTLGGAIANDVHGKNHHRRGTFGRHVLRLMMERSDLGRFACDPDEHPDLFRATIGGLGLTGLIRAAAIRLMPVASLTIRQTVTRFDRLADYFALAPATDEAHEYAVAWIDSLATGRSAGRGHLIAGDHAKEGDRTGIARPPGFSVPFAPPVSPLTGPTLRAFNILYFNGARPGTTRSEVPFDSFFYPLDRIGHWNRLYGRRGLHQHQSVVPEAVGEAAVDALLDCARSHRQGSFLTVLKRFGPMASPGLLSFPAGGYTLTLDVPDRGRRTRTLLADLDRIVVEAGGRINPYKDARMSPAVFAAGFPQWRDLEAMRDPVIMSDFWQRTAMRLA